jgi:sphingomyelin phosphodiesterase 2
LHAPYETEPNDSYICHRTAQAWEIAGLMRTAYAKGQIVLAMGDFNMIPLSLAHKIVEKHGRALDAWRIHHPDSSIGAAIDAVEKTRGVPIPDAAYNLSENGATCDSVLNTWRWDKGQQHRLTKGETITVDPSTTDPRAKRLDYIFFADALKEYSVKSINVGMTMRHPTLQTSLSDHFSVEATLEKAAQSPFADHPKRLANMLTSGELDRSDYLPVETYDSILAMINSYDARERRQRRLRLSHFSVQLTVAIGCLVAVWWSPRNFVAFLLMLLSTLGLSAGVIDGLIGGLFVGSELRALKEFEWDIKNARGVAAAMEPLTSPITDASLNKDDHHV